MAKNLSVTINGKEYVSGEAKKAETSLVSLKDVSQKVMDGLKFGAEAASAAIIGMSAAAGALAVKLGKDVVQSYGELQQNLGGADAVFGQYAEAIKMHGEEAYRNLGASQSEYLATANKMGALFQGSGIEQQKSLDLTAQAMQRAADMASVMGIDVQVALDSVAGAAKGNFTMMDNLGVAMNATTLEAYALSKGLDFTWASATNAEKAEIAMQMFFENTSQYAGNFARESEQTITGSLGLFGAAYESFIAGLGNADADMSNLTGNMTDAFKSVVANITPILDNLVGAIPDALGAIMDAVLEVAPSLVESASGIFDKILTVVTESLPGLVGLGSKLLESLIAGISNNTDQIATAVTNILIALVDFVTANLPTVVGAAVKIVVALGKGLVQAIPQMATSVWEMVTGMINEVMKYVPNFILLGQNLIAGLVQGVKDWAANAVDAVKDVGTKVIDGFKNLFGIHSPSTVFADFGKNMMEGLAIGISGNSGLVSTALKNAGLTPEGGNLDVSVSGTSAGGGIMGQIGGGMGEFIASLSSIQSLLDPISTILGGVMEVLGPAIDQILSPLVGILKIVGNVIGKMLIPVFQLLSPIIEFIAKAFVWFYNKAIVPVANGFITVFNAIRIGFANIINGIIRAINRIPFVNVGYVSVPGISDGTLSAIDMNTLTQAGSSGASGSSYTGGGSGSSSSVQSVNINIYQTFNGNVIGDGGMESVGEFIVDAIRAYSGVGGNVQVVSA